MSHFLRAVELIGLVYLSLCLFVSSLFLIAFAITDLIWRRRQRKRAKTAYIREWRIT
jgi:hypothetical protein